LALNKIVGQLSRLTDSAISAGSFSNLAEEGNDISHICSEYLDDALGFVKGSLQTVNGLYINKYKV